MEVAPREFVFTLKNYQTAYASEYTYSTFRNSLIFASGSAALSFVLGTILAWLTERTNTPLRAIFVPIAVVPLILPGVLESIAWIFLLSPKFGYLNVWLKTLFGLDAAPFNVFSLPGMIWVHSVGQVPLAFLMMTAAFKSMDPSLEESAMMSGANTWQTFKRVTLRLLMPTAGSVLLILFVRTLESFETPALIGIPARIYVYTSEIFLAFNEYPPDYGRGGRWRSACCCSARSACGSIRAQPARAKSFRRSPERLSGRGSSILVHGDGLDSHSSRSISFLLFCCLSSYCCGRHFYPSLQRLAGMRFKSSVGITIDTSIPFGRFGTPCKTASSWRS